MIGILSYYRKGRWKGLAKQDLIQRYEEAYRRYENRIKSWTKKFHAVMKQIPKVKYTTNISEKSIERLEKQKWGEFSERKRKEGRKQYEILYENKAPSVYTPKPPYTPPTEQDYFNNTDYGEDYDREWEEQHPFSDEPDEDGYTENVISRDEIEAWIDANINTITVERELDGVREQLNNLVLEAADQFGDYEAYLAYLEQNAGILNELAQKAISGYVGKNGKIYQEDPQALAKFATVLNLKRPLTPSQSDRLESEGWVSFDFNE